MPDKTQAPSIPEPVRSRLEEYLPKVRELREYNLAGLRIFLKAEQCLGGIPIGMKGGKTFAETFLRHAVSEDAITDSEARTALSAWRDTQPGAPEKKTTQPYQSTGAQLKYGTGW